MGDELHRYRICEVQSREKRYGRPRRLTVVQWDELTTEDVATLRRLYEPKLLASQIAELDGKIVARGTEVSQADVDDSETSSVPEAVRSDNPAEVTEFAHRMCWDIYERDMAASAELRKQTQQLNERALEQGKQIDAMINELVALRADMLRQQPATRGLSFSMEDLKELVQASAMLVRDMSKVGSGTT